MNLSINGIAISVVATQDTVESDSYGKDYDQLAEYPVYAAVSVETDENGLLSERQSSRPPKSMRIPTFPSLLQPFPQVLSLKKMLRSWSLLSKSRKSRQLHGRHNPK